ncbi:Transmembrane protein 26 family-containing protein [Strongyloides ratti]|uniref:Transmembrane protein 26 family-containing protein n=1 Tax=Strongyloides ratti TaxID=34506 RepID=A0A090LIP9_STRRB|nr:Transmembrane protein 26 family-containing protein [Strongyloides ratti]CEF67375.1 Transmembrane protein 26 family-containing protein [Strongyloides ratti]
MVDSFFKRCCSRMKLFIFIFLPLFYTLTKGSIIDRLPHCSKSQIMEGEIKETNEVGNNISVFSVSQLQMSLNDTVCLLVSNNNETNILYTLQYLRLEQHYPIIGSYNFGIPLVSTNCICDCPGGDKVCSISTYNYKNCSNMGDNKNICYRTYYDSQSNTGCFGSQKSEVCCEISFEPYKNLVYKTIKVKQPDTILVFQYKIFERIHQRWRLYDEDIFEIPLNKGEAKFELMGYNKIQLSVSGGKPHRQLEPGMYFWQEGESDKLIRGNVPINDIQETSLDKLGWMRQENNGFWSIRKGQIKIKNAHHVDIENCKLQKYKSMLNAEQFIIDTSNNNEKNISLGNILTEEPWVKSINVEDGRVMKVIHSEGISIFGTVKTQFKPLMLTHSSQFSSFNGTIQLDKESNRFLNITFYEAKGTVIGMVYSSEDKTNIDIVFSVLIDGTSTREFNCIITVPGSVNSTRYVCFHPAGDVRGQQCSWLPYKSVPLPVYTVSHRWVSKVGECDRCNERGLENLFVQMDPRKWFDGINTTTELLMFIFEISIGILIVLIIITMCTKCIIPLFRCGICITKIPKKRHICKMLRINEEEDHCDTCLLHNRPPITIKKHHHHHHNQHRKISNSFRNNNDPDDEAQFFMTKFSQGDMILFNITRAILARSLFIIHSILTIWQTVKIRGESSIWTFALISISIVIEGSHTIIMRVGDERKWFSPSIALYIASTAPPIWLMETKMCEWRKDDELRKEDGLYFQLIEQLLLVVLIIGRWMLPKGEISREQLSQILLAYLAISSDIVEFFDVFKEKVVYTNYTVQLLVLGAWTLSLLQFPFILTNTRARKMRVAITVTEYDESTINFNNNNKLNVIYDIDIWAIVLANGLQDIPFLCVRLFLIFQYRLVTYTMMFFICKNALIIALQTYRGFVLFNDRYLGNKQQQQSPLQRSSRIEMKGIPIPHQQQQQQPHHLNSSGVKRKKRSSNGIRNTKPKYSPEV